MKFDNVEFTNPILKFKQDVVNGMVSMRLNSERFKKANNSKSLFDFFSEEDVHRYLRGEALKIWIDNYKNIMNSSLPESIFEILECDNKKQQHKILDKLSLTTDSLSKFIIKAWEDYGFTYSVYSYESAPHGLDLNKMPPMALKKDDGSIQKFCFTSLKDGEIKNAIEHRKVTIAKFLDKGNIWHSFFYNYKSINGKEAGGTPYIHYISNAWTLTRDFVLQKFKNGKHPDNSTPHIDYSKYAWQCHTIAVKGPNKAMSYKWSPSPTGRSEDNDA